MKRSFSIEDVFFVVLLMVATIGLLWIVRDFLESVFWAALLASLFHTRAPAADGAARRSRVAERNAGASCDSADRDPPVVLRRRRGHARDVVAVSARHQRRDRPQRADAVVGEGNADRQRSADAGRNRSRQCQRMVVVGCGDGEPLPGEPRAHHRAKHAEPYGAVLPDDVPGVFLRARRRGAVGAPGAGDTARRSARAAPVPQIRRSLARNVEGHSRRCNRSGDARWVGAGRGGYQRRGFLGRGDDDLVRPAGGRNLAGLAAGRGMVVCNRCSDESRGARW